MARTNFKDTEVSICGLTFLCTGYVYAGRPATHWEQKEDVEVGMLDIKVKGQSDADADSILSHLLVKNYDGYELLEQAFIENWSD
jgi:hypothetical protein